MKKLKIFPKMFIQIFSVLGIIIILVHLLVYFIFPKTYLETRKEKIHNIADEISGNMNGKEMKYIEQTLELYSKSSEIKAFIKEKNNITYTMLSYTTITNGLNVPAGKSYLLNKYDKEQVKKDIEAVRDKVDVLIVAMHWGVEYINMPNDEEKEIAEYLSSLGVDIVIGNHPHILQPITKIGDTIVMYSLGNFISNQYGGSNGDWNKLIGFMATLDITKTVSKDNEATMTFDNLGGELIFTKYNGNPVTTAVHTGHTVIPFSKMTDDSYLKDYERLYNKYTGVLKSLGQDLNIAPIGSRAN